VTTWRDVWQRRGAGTQPRLDLSELMRLDGYDTDASRVSEDAFVTMVARARERLDLCAGDRFCEVGCGAGAFLYPLYRAGVRRVYGVDYAASLLAVGAALMPDGVFAVAEASRLPLASAAFDAVASNSVFHYFPSHAYAEAAVLEMLRILRPGGRGLVLDVIDAARWDAYETMRRAALPSGEYERLYRDLPHLAYNRAWWTALGEANRVRVEFFEQEMSGYHNGPFRYNVLLEKPSAEVGAP
jgi:SAM-dependent methyltransferase